MSKISYDSRAILIEGKRMILLSGSIHYPRSTPGMWPELMRKSRKAGLNTIETYVFWNLHEKIRGIYDFSDRLDLRRYCELAQSEGLNLILRIGPYICAETNFGGLPPWLRDVPGMTIRTFNKPFMDEMERWMRMLVEYLRPCFAGNGGPIIMAQVENEYDNIGKYYGEGGEKYCKWAVDLGVSLNLGVPWIMCSGSAPGSIETINGFLAHHGLERQFKEHPDQPAIWTENWPGWYDTWGYSHHARSPEHVAYGVARFFAGGGTGVNYYMWHGGTNFGRESMYLQTTSYDFDAPLDEYGMETRKSRHLAKLHKILADASGILLHLDSPEIRKIGNKASAFIYDGKSKGRLVFLCNDDTGVPASISFEGRTYELKPASVVIIRNNSPVLDTAVLEESKLSCKARWTVKSVLSKFETWEEPIPDDGISCSVRSKTPVEQLSLTRDDTDYCWYTTTMEVKDGRQKKGFLSLKGVADYVYVFIDGQLMASTPVPLKENRVLENDEDFTQAFEFSLKPGRYRLQILCCALGLIKGDWMLGFKNMVKERKGLWGSTSWDGKLLKGDWTMFPGLQGERFRLYDVFACQPEWSSKPRSKRACLRWWRTSFPRPKGNSPIALDLSSMGKGLAWINGICIGRYWLAKSVGRNPISPRDAFIDASFTGMPTQTLYHVPRDFVKDTNSLVIFEEQGGDPNKIRLMLRN